MSSGRAAPAAAAVRLAARWSLAALAALPSLAGCRATAVTVHNAREAQNRAMVEPGERTPTAAELGLPKSGPVALDALVAAAVRVSPAVVRARQAVETARARCRAAEGARLPQVSANASADYQDRGGSSGSSSSTSSSSHGFASLGFDVSWLIFDFGQTVALTRNAGLAWLAAQQDLRAAEVDAAFGVRSAYFDLAKRIHLLAADEETVRQFQAHLDQVKEQLRVGSKRIPYDETKADVDLGNARVAEAEARNAALTGQASLAHAVGLAEIVDWTPADESPWPAMPDTFDGAWAAAEEGQPSLAAATARARAASALVDARIAALYPEVTFGLGVNGSGSTLPLPWNVQVGPAVRWTPFDGFQNLSTIDEAVASLRDARASRAEAEQQTWLDARTAWLSIEDARKRLDLTALVVKSAEENMRLAQGRFEAGLGTSIELADAQQALTAAREGAITAQADLATAGARLAQVLGVTDSRK